MTVRDEKLLNCPLVHIWTVCCIMPAEWLASLIKKMSVKEETESCMYGVMIIRATCINYNWSQEEPGRWTSLGGTYFTSKLMSSEEAFLLRKAQYCDSKRTVLYNKR